MITSSEGTELLSVSMSDFSNLKEDVARCVAVLQEISDLLSTMTIEPEESEDSSASVVISI